MRHLPPAGIYGPCAFWRCLPQENYRWPGEEGFAEGPRRGVLILGLSVQVWSGIIAALFYAGALAAVYLQRKYKKIAKGRWHHRLAIIGSAIVLIHIVLAVLRRFFQIVPL